MVYGVRCTATLTNANQLSGGLLFEVVDFYRG